MTPDGGGRWGIRSSDTPSPAAAKFGPKTSGDIVMTTTFRQTIEGRLSRAIDKQKKATEDLEAASRQVKVWQAALIELDLEQTGADETDEPSVLTFQVRKACNSSIADIAARILAQGPSQLQDLLARVNSIREVATSRDSLKTILSRDSRFETAEGKWSLKKPATTFTRRRRLLEDR